MNKSFIFSLLTIIAFMSAGFSAGDLSAQVTSSLVAVDTASVFPGDTATVGIKLTNSGTPVSGGQFVLTASPASKVNLTDVVVTARTSGWSVADSTSGSGRLILFYSGSGSILSRGAGSILNVKYALTASAVPGDSIVLSLSLVKLADSLLQQTPATVQSGRISVRGCTLSGDVTSDGSVNIYDLLLIVQYALALKTPSSYQFDCADINNDQVINNIDVVLCVNIILSAGAGTLLASVQEQDIRLNRDETSTLLNGLKALKVEPEKIEKISLMLASSATRAQLPRAFALQQNSPNPFNPSTTISFSVPEGSSVQVRLQVFDLRGRLVATLAEGIHESGVHSVFWDGTDNSGRKVSSGVYFYRINADDFTQTRKMVMLK